MKEVPKLHELKILPNYFEDVMGGVKTFELRKYDRDYEVGDMITLKEWNDNHYTKRELFVEIVYILRDCPEYGLMDGYVILGID
jgi:hypothetical protein